MSLHFPLRTHTIKLTNEYYRVCTRVSVCIIGEEQGYQAGYLESHQLEMMMMMMSSGPGSLRGFGTHLHNFVHEPLGLADLK